MFELSINILYQWIIAVFGWQRVLLYSTSLSKVNINFIDDVVCEVHTFEVFGTGFPIPPKARKFLKTVHHSSGLVLHYYEVV